MRRIELPDDGWADVISDIDEVTGRRLRTFKAYMAMNGSLINRVITDNPTLLSQNGKEIDETEIVAAIGRVSLTAQDMFAAEDLADAVAASSLLAWSLASPLPVAEAVIDLPIPTRAALHAGTAACIKLFLEADPSFAPTTEVDPENPTGPRAPSGGRSKAKTRKRTAPQLGS